MNNQYVNETYDPKSGKARLVVSRVGVYIALVVVALLCLFPFVVLIMCSTQSHGELQGVFSFKFSSHVAENFSNAWNDFSVNIPRGMLNSFIIAAATSILTTYFSALTAYGIHAYEFKGKKLAFTFIMAVMMIPPQCSAVGFIQLCNQLKLTNNYLPLIVPAIAAPVVFFYMKQYMDSVLPLEIVEAARVDGCNEFRTFNQIVLPILKPAMAVQGIFSFVGSWNNYFTPALLLDKKELKTVPIMIAQLRSADYSKFDQGKLYMFILLAILPVIVVYLILSKFIIKNVTAGAVKG